MNNQNREIEVPTFLKRETIEHQRIEQERMRMESQKQAMYENARRNSNKKRKKRKAEIRKKLVSTAFVAGASFAIGILSVHGYQQSMGSDRIANEFNTYTEGYGIMDTSNGYLAFSGGKEISLDSAMEDIVNDARYGGMSDVEINIGITKVYNGHLASKYVGEFTHEEKTEAKYNAYYESKIEEYSKNNGGISR